MLRIGDSVARKIGLEERSDRRPIVDASLCRHIRHLPLRSGLLICFVALMFGAAPISSKGQTITEYRLETGSAPNRIVAGPDGALWFTEWFGTRVDRITTDGVVTEFPVHSLAEDITAGPDGNLWFTLPLANTIGSITTFGSVKEFPIPWTPVSCGPFCEKGAPMPRGIAAGADGNLWFTEPNIGKIGRMTPAGVVTEFPLSSVGLGGLWLGIVTGPDGAIWFSTARSLAGPSSGQRIGRITTTGLITDFRAPSDVVIDSITVGVDGALWFIQGGFLGRMSMEGTAEKFPMVGLGSNFTSEIALGPDGNLWFTSPSFTGFPNRIGRITADGVTSFPVSVPTVDLPHCGVCGITAGPDGAMWFTEWDSNKIGRITVPPASRELVTPTDRDLKPRAVPFRNPGRP